jgi:MFS family permease
MPLYAYFGAKNPSVKRSLLAVSLLAGAIVLLGRAIASSMIMIIVVMTLWGLVSAGLFAIGFTMIRDMFDQQKSGTYLGLIATFMSLGMLTPFISGIIIDQLGWRVFNWVAFAIMFVAALLVWFGVKATKEEAKPLAIKMAKFDLVGGIALTAFLVCLVVPLSLGTYIPLGSLPSNAMFAIAAVCLVALIVIINKKGGSAIIPKTVLKDRNTMVFFACLFITVFTAMAVTFFVPTYIILVMTADPLVVAIGPATAGGVAVALTSIVGIFLGPVLGKIIGKTGDVKLILTIGTILRIIIFAALLFLLKPTTPVWVIFVLLFVAGFYQTQNQTTYSVGPQIQIKPEIRVQGNAVVQLAQNLGGMVGLAVFTMIMSMNGPVDGMPVAFAVSLVGLVALLVLGFFLKKLDPEKADDR